MPTTNKLPLAPSQHQASHFVGTVLINHIKLVTACFREQHRWLTLQCVNEDFLLHCCCSKVMLSDLAPVGAFDKICPNCMKWYFLPGYSLISKPIIRLIQRLLFEQEVCILYVSVCQTRQWACSHSTLFWILTMCVCVRVCSCGCVCVFLSVFLRWWHCQQCVPATCQQRPQGQCGELYGLGCTKFNLMLSSQLLMI